MTEEEDQRAREELKKNFGEVSVTDCELVCDSCYREILDWKRKTDGES